MCWARGRENEHVGQGMEPAGRKPAKWPGLQETGRRETEPGAQVTAHERLASV